MSRKLIFLVMATVVVLYFSIIMFMLTPLHTAKGAYSDLNNLQLRHIPAVNWCKKLQWQIPPSPYLVALASAPGSGNTWLRYLLQQVTGILTGSIYLDLGLLRHGFPGEQVTNGSVLVIKTHEVPPKVELGMAVLLIRQPRDSLLADYNRLHKGHIGTAPKTAFKGNKAKIWQNYVSIQISQWETFYTFWLMRFHGPIHIVFYDALVQDTRKELQKILDFLNFKVTEEDMDCAILNKEGIYRRKKKHSNFDPFTPEMHRELERVKDRVYKKISEFQEKDSSDKRNMNVYPIG